MKYSEFTTEQLMNERGYNEICSLFMSLALTDDIKKELESILYNGGTDNYEFYSHVCSKDNPTIEIERRLSMAYLLITNPKSFMILKQNNINLFHGTNANALFSILNYGLNSVDELKKMGIEVSTGERWSRIGGERNFISFTDVLDIAHNYSSLGTTDENKDMSFEVIIGTTKDEVLNTDIKRVNSDLPEVAVMNRFPLSSIKVILVPKDKIEFVKKIIGDKTIVVGAIDNIENKFYNVSDFGVINIYKDKLEKINSNNKRKFNSEEVKQTLFTRSIQKIKKYIEEIENMSYTEEVVYDGRKSK